MPGTCFITPHHLWKTEDKININPIFTPPFVLTVLNKERLWYDKGVTY